MDFTEGLTPDLQAALKAGRRVEASPLRLLLTAVRNREVERRGQLGEPEILQVIVKECNQRREAIQQFRQGKREDLACKEVREAIASTGARSVKDMGKVMSHLMAQLAGRADGKVVSQLVRQELSGEG